MCLLDGGGRNSERSPNTRSVATIDLEVKLQPIWRVVDVLVTFPSGWKQAHEVQLAAITTGELRSEQMTTPLWESTLFGGWAIMRTPRPIASGVLRRLAIASVFSSTSEVTSATCWLPVIGEFGLPTAAPQQLWPRLGEGVPRFDWERTILSAPRTTIRVISASQGKVRVLAVKGLEAHVEQGSFGSATRFTTWKPVWGSVWASLME